MPVNGPVILADPVPWMIGLISTLEFSATCIVPCAAETIWFESGSVSNAARALARAICTGDTPSPEKPKLPPVGSASERTVTPLPNVCEPENDIDIGVALAAFSPTTLSQSRPAQPVTLASDALSI